MGQIHCYSVCIDVSTTYFRMYHLPKLNCPSQTLPLNTNDTSSSKFSSALGESFVSMAFGQPIATTVEHHTVWPLYLLTELGCVYVMHTKLWSNTRSVK